LANDITFCTACGAGLQLSQGNCISCPEKCKSCSSGKCAICISGYRPNSAGVCVKNCELPCATCVDNRPKVCTGCYSGSVLSGTNCAIDLSCNDHGNCTDCGQGTGYILIGASCLRCGNIQNCVQCSQTNSQLCAICNNGYFINGTICSSCPSSCISCISSTTCTGCQLGYTLSSSVTQGQCMKCT